MNLEPRNLNPVQRFPLRGGGSAIVRRVTKGTFCLFGDIVFAGSSDATLAIWTAEGKYYASPRITCELDFAEIPNLK